MTPTNQYALVMRYNIHINNRTLNHSHRVRIEVDLPDPAVPPIGEDLANINLVGRDGTLVDAQTRLASYAEAFDDAYSGSDFDLTEVGIQFYEYGLQSAGLYVAQADLGSAPWPDITGGLAPDSVPAKQVTLSLFTSAGKVSRIIMLETGAGVDNAQYIPSGADPLVAIAADVIAPDSPFRDANGAQFTALKLASVTQNEALYRKRFR